MKFKTAGRIQELSSSTNLSPLHMTPSWCLPLQPHSGVEFQSQGAWSCHGGHLHISNPAGLRSVDAQACANPSVLFSRWIWLAGRIPGWQHSSSPCMETWQLSSVRSKLFIHPRVSPDVINGDVGAHFPLAH